MSNRAAIFLLTCVIALFSCKSAKVDYSTFFWGELEEGQNYLFRADSLTSIVDGELSVGSVILIGLAKGEFYEVYINLKQPSKASRAKYFLYKPKFKKLGLYSTGDQQKLVLPPVDNIREYHTGERGGCFYYNSSLNRVYVDRSFCRDAAQKKDAEEKARQASEPKSSSGGDIQVKGYYRTSKSGKTIYVKPHTRRRN